MKNRIAFFVVLICAQYACFGQASAIRDYVGMISQTFHPDVVSHMEGIKDRFQKRGNNDVVRSIDFYLRGDSGTGFVYVAADGKNYIITNFHVISHAQIDGLSVTFENTEGEKTRYSGLSIVAADEDLDIAVLAFAGNRAIPAEMANPFTQGLVFLNRPAQDLDNVFSAGFPRLGTSMVWQLGSGIISNASVRIPDPDDETKTFGPYIQHTAQVDPGNSGGPLLVRVEGVPTGFAVAGINTLSARFRQGANYSIPMNRVQVFLDAALKPKTGSDLAGLEARLDSFLEGLSASKAYPHIATYLSNSCTAENFEYAEFELADNAGPAVWKDYAETFNSSPVTGMSYAVGWLIESKLRSKSGSISITKDSVTAIDDNNYTVVFNVNNTAVSSQWINEYGIWRINTFGNFAVGDKSILGKKQKEQADAKRLVTAPSLRISASYVNIFDMESAVGADFKIGSKYVTFGFQGFFGKEHTQIEGVLGFTIPIRMGAVALIPFADIGGGIASPPMQRGIDMLLGFSVKGGLMFTTAAVPGLYLQAAYLYGFFDDPLEKRPKPHNPNMLIIGLGYSL